MPARGLIALAALIAPMSLAHAADVEIATLLRECPALGWHRACLPIEFTYTFDGTERIHEKTWVDKAGDRHGGLDYIVIDAALADGGGRATFHLKLNDFVRSAIADPGDLGPFTYIGRSSSGRPIVLTDRGPLEILTPGVDVVSTTNLAVLRRSDNALLSKRMGANGMPFVATKSGEVGVWDEARGICIEAPTRQARAFKLITEACKQAGVPAKGARIGGNAKENTTISDVEAGQLTKEEPTGVGAFDVPGTPLMFIWFEYDYCC